MSLRNTEVNGNCRQQNPSKFFSSLLSSESLVMTWSYLLKKDCHGQGQCDIYFRKMKHKIPISVISSVCFTTQTISEYAVFLMNRNIYGAVKVIKDCFTKGFLFRFHAFAEEWPPNDMFLEATVDLSQSWVIWRKVPLCNC